MEVVFNNSQLENLYRSGKDRGKPPEIVKQFIKRVNFMKKANGLNDLYARTSFHCEKLKGNLVGKMSIRLNQKWRLIFSVDDQGRTQVIAIEELSNHYS